MRLIPRAEIPTTEPLRVLREAIRAVPAVRFALGSVGVAAAGALIAKLLGYDKASIIMLSGTFISMFLLYAFGNMVSSKNASSVLPGVFLLYTVTLFFSSFMLFTVTAFALGWPPAWAEFLGAKVLNSHQLIDADSVTKSGLDFSTNVIPQEISRSSSGLSITQEEGDKSYKSILRKGAP